MAEENRVFRHVVGRSTLKEGITVHKDFEDLFDSPEVGSKRTIRLVYDGGEADVVLRRLNNKSRHVQMKYETAANRPFRQWLEREFAASTDGTTGGAWSYPEPSTTEGRST